MLTLGPEVDAQCAPSWDAVVYALPPQIYRTKNPSPSIANLTILILCQSIAVCPCSENDVLLVILIIIINILMTGHPNTVESKLVVHKFINLFHA